MRTFSWKRSAAHARAMGRQRRAPKFIEVSLPRPLTRRQCEQFKLTGRRSPKIQNKENALCRRTTHIPTLRFAMGLSTPMLLNADSLPEILTARELEGFIRIDVKTIYAYVKGGQIPYMRMGSNLRFCKREILAWLEERHYRP